jgi:hypothetical protein
MKPSDSLDRRQFLQAGTRYALLSALGSLAVAGELKRRRLADDPNCVRVWTCADCVEFGACAKPKAQDFRRTPSPADARPR